jgi:hypothetical protein
MDPKYLDICYEYGVKRGLFFFGLKEGFGRRKKLKNAKYAIRFRASIMRQKF